MTFLLLLRLRTLPRAETPEAVDGPRGRVTAPLTGLLNVYFLIILTIMVSGQHGSVLEFKTENPTNLTSSTRNRARGQRTCPTLLCQG